MLTHDPRPHPTRYNGRQYRSRLEARWAAFFDQLGWPFEYEPYDLGSWSPDFLLRGASRPILVEVKPIVAPDLAVCQKMADAANATDFTGELLLLGVSPDIEHLDWPHVSSWLGWLEDGPDPWFDCDATEEDRRRQEDGERIIRELQGTLEAVAPYRYQAQRFEPCWSVLAPGDRIDFCHPINAFMGRMTGAWDGDHHVDERAARMAKPLWEAACNAVQWHARR